MVHDSRRAALSREVWLSIRSPSGASVILGYACCPFCGNSVLVPRCDFIRQDPLRVNPALVAPLRGGPALAPVCDFHSPCHSLPSRRKSCAGLRVLVFRAPLRAAIHAGFFSAFRAVLGSQSVRPLPGLSYSGVGWVCIEPLRCSASVGISA